MNTDNPIDALLDIIANDFRHAYYQVTMNAKQFAKQIVTGEGQEDIVTDFRKAESKKQKEQRNRLTNTLTKYVISRPRKYWKKINRVEGVNVVFKTSDVDKLNQLQKNFENFSEGRDLLQWLNFKLEFLGVTDPNSWVIYERHDTRDAEGNIAQTKVYPFIVGCEDVIATKYEFGVLTALCVRQGKLDVSVDRNGVKTEKVIFDWYLYVPGKTIRIREAGVKMNAEPEADETAITIKGDQPGAKPKRLFVAEFNTGTTEVPALAAGAYLDEKTDQKTFVTWFDPAEHVFRDLIRDKSFLDVTKTTHVFPKRYEYVRPCEFQNKEGKCDKGWMSHDRTIACPSCLGSGKSPTFTTEQQVLQLSMPKGDSSQLLELSKLSHYEQLPIELPKWLDDQVDKSEKRVMNAVFNGGLIEKATGKEEKTATQVNYEYEDIYDVLQPFADTISRHYELAYRVGAQYLEISEFSVDHRFPKDFKMKTMSDLIEEFERLKKSGAGYDALRNVRRQIIEKQNEDNPQVVAAILARYDFLPFDDKTEEEVAQILAVRSPVDDQRVLRENWLEIFIEIENENIVAPFYLMTYEKKKAVVQAKVDQFKSKIVQAGAPDQEDPTAIGEGGADDDETDQPDAQ